MTRSPTGDRQLSCRLVQLEVTQLDRIYPHVAIHMQVRLE